MSTKTITIENRSPKYNRLLKNLSNQSTDTILEWKNVFQEMQSKSKM